MTHRITHDELIMFIQGLARPFGHFRYDTPIHRL